MRIIYLTDDLLLRSMEAVKEMDMEHTIGFEKIGGGKC